MRHIPYEPRNLKLPKGWSKEVQKLQQQLLNEKDQDKRAALIDQNENLWKEIKHQLASLFNNKCWYTESPQNGTDADVDHYRPKKRVAELNDGKRKHPGYWWLAFDLNNYRYSCIVANRRRRDVVNRKTGGKADHFPIIDESKRAWTPDCDCNEEQPLLLDPCKISDVGLLTFNQNGGATPKYSKRSKPRQYERADKSIIYYNLNFSDFVRARINLRDEIDKYLVNAQKYYNKIETGDGIHDAAFEESMQKLHKMCHSDSPYSRFCIEYLKTKDIDFVKEFITVLF